MITVTIDTQLLKSLALITPKNDVRYYLNGICVDFRADGTARLVTTDGHRLIVARLAHAEGDDKPTEARQFIIPRKIIQNLKVEKYFPTMTWNFAIGEENGFRSSVGGPHTSTEFKCIDGKFPDYERVIPLTVSGEAGCYNMHYLADLAKVAGRTAGKMDRGNGYTLYQNGESPALFVFHDIEAFGVQMPMRDGNKAFELPDWFTGKVEASEPAVAAETEAA
jgi:DNA polymerase III subunit beta